MPYLTNEDLPAGVRGHLPAHAQDIFREAFNHAWMQYGDDARQEQIAFRVAWAAVKKLYVKAGDQWILR